MSGARKSDTCPPNSKLPVESIGAAVGTGAVVGGIAVAVGAGVYVLVGSSVAVGVSVLVRVGCEVSVGGTIVVGIKVFLIAIVAVDVEVLLETAVGLSVMRLIESGRIDWSRFVEAISLLPARILGVNRGTLRPGAVADVTLIDPSREWQVNAASFASKSKNSPFDGRPVQGQVLRTVVDGRTVFVRES